MKRILRFAGLLIATIALVLFLAPLLVAGVLNIGNITGIILSLILVGYSALAPRVNDMVSNLWKNKKARLAIIIFSCFVILCASLAIIETTCIVNACMKAPAEKATAVVLGCRVYGERPSLSMIERLEAAYDYLTENPEAVCVVSGGKGDGENISEAECMYRWLVNKGIDSDRIYKEENSTSTEENIAFSKEIIVKEGLNQNIAIVTSEYHTYRAGLIAEANDLEYGTVPGQTAVWLFPTFYVRELYAILAEWIF